MFSSKDGKMIILSSPSGAGKTTLFRLIMNQISPDSGTFKIGDTVNVSYVDQEHKEIDEEKTICRNCREKDRSDYQPGKHLRYPGQTDA